MKLLYIEASPRKDQSASSRVAKAFTDSYQHAHLNDEVEHLALFEADLPSFTGEGANQKMDQIVDMIQGGDGIETVGEWVGVVAEVDRLAFGVGLQTGDQVLVPL